MPISLVDDPDARDLVRSRRQNLRTTAGGARRRVARRPRGRIRGRGRRLGLRQDHPAAPGQPAGRAERRAASGSTARTCARLDPIALRRRIGYVFQGIGLFPHMTVAENIAHHAAAARLGRGRASPRGSTSCSSSSPRPPPLPRPLPARAVRRRAPARGRGPRAGGRPAHHADGRAVRRARSAHPRRARRSDYRRLHDELGLTTVMITHDMLEALLLADRIAVLRDGRLVARWRAARADDRARGRRRARADADAAPPGRAAAARCWAAPHERPVDPRIADALARLPDYLGSHVLVSSRRWRSGSRSACRSRSARCGGRACARRCWASPASSRPSRAWRCWRCSIRCCWRSRPLPSGCRRRLLRARLPAGGAGADALQHAADPAQHGDRPARHRSGGRARPRTASA